MQQQDFVHQSDSHTLQKGPSIYQTFHIDLPILFLLFALMGFGLTVLYSADSSYLFRFQRQIMNLAVGVVVMCLIAQVHPKYFKYWSPILYVIGIVMLLLVTYSALGVKVNGSTRWLSMPIIGRFQPSEIIKLALPIMVAGYLGSKPMPVNLKHVLLALIIIMIPTVLINRQPDLGTSLLIAVSGLLVIFFAGLRWLYITLAGLLSIALGWVMWMFVLAEYQKTRIMAVIGNADLHAEGYNSHQAAIAIGSGGMYGKGFEQGTQSQLDFVPENDTDFIISVLGEEFGFIGFISLLAIYLAIVCRGFYIAAVAFDNYQRFLAASVTFTFFIYVFVNIGMVSGILPVVGVPLPLVSYGGTSVVTLLAGFGVLMSISTHRHN